VLLFACLPSLKYSIHANFIYEKFQIQSCEIPLKIFWQLMTFDIPTNNFKASSRKAATALFVASLLQRLFDKTRASMRSVKRNLSTGFLSLLLVIDCEKLISEMGRMFGYYSPQKVSKRSTPNRTNSIIVNKKIAFPVTSTTCERMMIYEIQ
jgi:hypothetical protein